MSETSDATSWTGVLLLGGLGLAIIAAPFVAGAQALRAAFALTVGGVLFAGEMALVSPVLAEDQPPVRPGG